MSAIPIAPARCISDDQIALIAAGVPCYGTVEQAAAIRQCSTKTIRRRIADGTIEARRLPGGGLLRVNLTGLFDGLEVAGGVR